MGLIMRLRGVYETRGDSSWLSNATALVANDSMTMKAVVNGLHESAIECVSCIYHRGLDNQKATNNLSVCSADVVGNMPR